MDIAVIISLNPKSQRYGGIIEIGPWKDGPAENPFLCGRKVSWPRFMALKLVIPPERGDLLQTLKTRWQHHLETTDGTGTPYAKWRRFHIRVDLIPQAARDAILARAANNEPTIIAASGGHYTWAQFRQYVHNVRLDKFESDADGAEGDGQLDL